jgi:hypothetical protein
LSAGSAGYDAPVVGFIVERAPPRVHARDGGLSVWREVSADLDAGDFAGCHHLGVTLEGTWTVVDGSGRFANATGSGGIDGVGDIPGGDALFGLPDGFAEFNLTGGIAYDASDRSK